jgi:alpha-beta hydrolase superfamily lysophospholipase
MTPTDPTVRIEQDRLPIGRGRALFYRRLLPEPARAAVLILHGIHEHSGRYEDMMRALGGHGLACWAPDYRGHGRSGRVPGDLEGMDRVLGDIERVQGLAAAARPGLPLFLLGHSLGGLVALRYALDHQRELAGLVLSATSVSIPDNMQVPAVILKAAALLARLLPRLPVQAFEWREVSRDPEVIREIRDDPLYYKGKIRARTGHELLRTMAAVSGRLEEIRLPVLVMNGGEDRLYPPRSSEEVHRRVASTDKTLRIFPGVWHELHREPERGEVFALVAGWIAGRVPGRIAGAQGAARP